MAKVICPESGCQLTVGSITFGPSIPIPPGVHYGFLADDEIGVILQAVGEAAAKKDVAGAIAAARRLLKREP